MNVLVIDSTGGEIGKSSYTQLKEFGLEVELKKVDFLDVPGVLKRSDADSYLVICDMAENYNEPVVEKILELELEKGIVEKVFLDSEGESKEMFERRAQRKSNEAAEELAEKLE